MDAASGLPTTSRRSINSSRTLPSPTTFCSPRGRPGGLLPHLTSGWVTLEGKDYWTALGKAATFVAQADETGQVERHYLDAGSSGPTGALIHYYLSDATASDPGAGVTLDFLDGNNGAVRSIRSASDGDEEGFATRAPKNPGLCRFVWDLRHEGVMPFPGNPAVEEADRGPIVVPGKYEVRLTIERSDGSATVQTAPLLVVNDPRRGASQKGPRAATGNPLVDTRQDLRGTRCGLEAPRSTQPARAAGRHRERSVSESRGCARRACVCREGVDGHPRRAE